MHFASHIFIHIHYIATILYFEKYVNFSFFGL